MPNSPSSCTSCKAGMQLSGTTCVQASTAVAANLLCPPNCLRCSNQICDTCESYYFLHFGRCVGVCPDGFYTNMTHCLACAATCRTCFRPNICATCYPNTFLTKTFACVSRCPRGTFAAGDICQDCQEPASECLNATFALLCRMGSFVSTNNLCVRFCNPG